MLLEKNASYGNSSLDPICCFHKGTSFEQICARIDDKLSRVMRGHEYPGDDELKDLPGYFIIAQIARHIDKHPEIWELPDGA